MEVHMTTSKCSVFSQVIFCFKDVPRWTLARSPLGHPMGVNKYLRSVTSGIIKEKPSAELQDTIGLKPG